MGLRFNYDYWNNLEIPSFVLCTVDKNIIGNLSVSERHFKYNNEIPEISFKIYKMIDGIENPYYDRVLELQYIYFEDIGYFQITKKPNIIIDSDVEYKEVTAQSSEIEFSQKYINTFTINMGTVESIDKVCLYQPNDSEHSLLDLVLEKIPSWSIGYVDPKIATLQRSFEIDNQDIYSFLTSDVATAFECLFIFNTLKNEINVYEQDSISEDTNIVISFNNLAKQIKIDPDIDSIKTCVTLIGEDDLTIRELNMGYDRIYNFDYFVTPEYMSDDLIKAYKNYKEKYIECNQEYIPLIKEYQNLIIEIAKLDHEMLPETPLPTKDGQLVTTEELANDETVWEEYCLTELNTYRKAYEGRQSVLMQKGYGEPSKSEYESLYLPVYNILNNINSEIIIRENQIESLKVRKDDLNVQMQNIISTIDIQKNFTEEQWAYLSKFIREETLSDSNYVVTDVMTQEEEFEMKQAFLDFGNKELLRVSQPQFSFTMDMANIFAIPEFKNQLDKFDLFNYITVLIRDDYYMKVKILSFDIDFEDIKNFSVTFGSIYKYKNTDIFTTAIDAMATASSASTSVSFNKFQWNSGTNDAFDIKGKISGGLINSGVSLNNSRSTMAIDERGLFMNNDSTSEYPNDKAALTGSNLLFTSDNWKTVRTALGRIQYTRSDGETINTYGLIAETVLAGYVGGSLIEGNTIKGNDIEGNKITGGTITGSKINNGNGTFSVDENGKLIANSANVKGDITATTLTATQKGTIGCWTITSNALYNNITFDNNKNSNSTGLGTYGSNWAFWAGNGKFSVTQDGKLVATNADIAGKISTDNITATSGTFTNVTIGERCQILGSCNIAARTWGEEFIWNGNPVGSSYIDDALSSKSLSKCYSLGSFSLNSIGSGNCLTLSNGGAILKGNKYAGLDSGTITLGVGTIGAYCSGGLTVQGDLSCTGAKPRIVKTTDYGTIRLIAYETPNPTFADIGKSELDIYGISYIWIDPQFYEVIESECTYKVFLTKYGLGDLYVDMDNSTKDYFIVKGTPGLKFAWEIKCIQKGLNNTRMSINDFLNAEIGNDYNYGYEGSQIVNTWEGELDYAI